MIAVVVYAVLHAQSTDSRFEDKILAGDPIQSLTALKQYTIQNIVTIFSIIIVTGVFGLFGGLLHFTDTTKHETTKRQKIIRKATKSFEEVDDDLRSKMKIGAAEIERLEAENTIKKYRNLMMVLTRIRRQLKS